MTKEEAARGFYLEEVLDKLLDFQARQGAESIDSMLMLSLVNLLGIVSLLNKQSGTAAAQAPGGMNHLVGTLLNMLSGQPQQQARGAESGPAPGVLNPAALMNLLSPQPGKAPDPAALFKMLSSLMGALHAKPPEPAGAQEQQEQKDKVRAEGFGPEKVKEIKKTPGPLKWDARLGNATG